MESDRKPSDGGSQAGWVYFIQCEDAGAIKIGWTEDSPYSRLKELQTGCPAELEMIAAVPGDRRLERSLHRRFAEYRMCGEWFESEAAWSYIDEQLAAILDDMIGSMPELARAAERDRPDQERRLVLRDAYFARLEAAKSNP